MVGPSQVGNNRNKEIKMKTHRLIALLAAILLIASLAACNRSIPGSNKPVSTTPAGGAAALPTGGATDVLEQIYLFATQTAMATQGLTTSVPQAQTGAQTTPGAPVATGASVQPPAQPPQQVQPTPAPVIVAPPATPGLPSSYTLQRSEFPYCIARRFNVDPGELLRMNGLTSYSVYYGGMVLRIPQSGRGFPGNRSLRPHPATYNVRPGDTLFSIACIYGDVDPNMIAYVNNIQVNAKLEIGQQLNIP
jgi:LysM repeat protein